MQIQVPSICPAPDTLFAISTGTTSTGTNLLGLSIDQESPQAVTPALRNIRRQLILDRIGDSITRRRIEKRLTPQEAVIIATARQVQLAADLVVAQIAFDAASAVYEISLATGGVTPAASLAAFMASYTACVAAEAARTTAATALDAALNPLADPSVAAGTLVASLDSSLYSCAVS